MNRIKLLASVALAAVMVAPIARAGSLYAFGDSLSDNGNLFKLTGKPPAPYYQGRFSNGPVWVEYLPGLINRDFSAANDHAYGGAFTGPLTINGQSLGTNLDGASLPGVSTEIAGFAASGGSFSRSDVVALWGGANNYFAYGTAVQQLAGAAQAAAMQAQTASYQAKAAMVAAAQAAQAGDLLSAQTYGLQAKTYAASAQSYAAQAEDAQAQIHPLIAQGVTTTLTQLTQDTNQLINLGATMLIVPNLPDLGATPEFNSSAQGVQLGDAFSSAHNANLPGLMQQLHQGTGANIIVLNTQALLETVIKSPGTYGFGNVTDACIDSAACVASPTIQNSYLFWDSVHPTTRAQQVIAAYAAASLRGFESLTVPARVNNDAAQNFTSVLNGRLDALQNGASGISYGIDGTNEGSADPLHKLSMFLTVGGQFGSQHSNSEDFATGYSYNSTVTAMGVDYRWNEHVITGLALGYNDTHADLKEGNGKVRDEGVNVGIYGLMTEGDAYAEFTGGYDKDNDKATRTGVLGGITGKPDGQTWSASTTVGLNFHPQPQTLLGPDAGLEYTNSGLGAYTESGDPLLTQNVEAQNDQQLVGTVGLHSSTTMIWGNMSLVPYANAGAAFRLSSQSRHFTSSFTDMPGVTLTNTYPTTAGSWGVFAAGLTAKLTQQLDANLNVATTAFKSDGNDTQVNGNVNWRF